MAMQTVSGPAGSGGTVEAVGMSGANFTHASVRTHSTPARRVPARGRPLPGPRGYPLIGMLP
ncbi:MAG TPA: hypothetical protein VM032_19360, partial [Vicinamibacterales bacterium]|nr:hypothetical protein [Vicinamibacterales bacterium]